MKNKIVIYTAIFGRYDGLIPQPRFPGIDYVCFTDSPIKSKSWEIKQVERQYEDPTLDARHHKILGYKYLSEYDISIYIDGNFLMLSNPRKLIEEYFSDNTLLAFFDHENSDDRRNCIYKEYEALIKLGEERGHFKDDPDKMKSLMDLLESEGYPEGNGLISSGVLIRKHNDPELIELMDNWWKYVVNYTRRDQLSFNFALWKTGFKRYKILTGDIRKGNPWFFFLGHHRKSFTLKLLKIKLKTIL